MRPCLEMIWVVFSGKGVGDAISIHWVRSRHAAKHSTTYWAVPTGLQYWQHQVPICTSKNRILGITILFAFRWLIIIPSPLLLAVSGQLAPLSSLCRDILVPSWLLLPDRSTHNLPQQDKWAPVNRTEGPQGHFTSTVIASSCPSESTHPASVTYHNTAFQ